jgi:hypothetical protein
MIILGTNSIKDTGYDVANSCRFNDAKLVRTTSSAGVNTKGTFSAWVKRSAIGSNQNLILFYTSDGYHNIYFRDTNEIRIYANTSGGTTELYTNRLFRDVSAWYHIVVAYDSTQGTASNRIKLYINGVQETSFATANYPAQNANMHMNRNSETVSLAVLNASDWYYSGYMAEVVWIDGTQYAASDFGEFDSDSPTIWKPIDVSGLTFGTNGFYLDFEDSGDLGDDESGNGNDFAETGLAAIDQSIDSITNNFNTMNPLNRFQYNFTFSEGNLKLANSDNNWFGASGTIAINKGKWFFEAKYTGSSNLQHFFVGFTGIEAQNAADATRNSVAFYNNDGGEVAVSDVSNNASTTADYGTFAQNDIIGVALDYDNELISFYKNGSAIVTNFDFGATTYPTGLTDGKLLSPFIGHYASSDIALNFGSPPYSESGGNSDGNGFGNFSMSVPSGYYSLNTKNLAEFG